MDNNAENPNSKVAFDPGWNDPPPLTFNQQTNKPRNFLNKRVAFPLTGSTPSPSSLPVNMPPSLPMGIPAGLPIVHTNPQNVSNKATEEEIDSQSALQEVKSIFLNILESSAELGSKSNDIKRRIGVMEEMWTSGKLNSKVQVQMKKLANALQSEEPKTADEIHRLLMIEHVSAVGSWMPGVKQLVHHCIARSELLSIDKESNQS